MPLPSDRRRETIVAPLASSRTSDTGGSAAGVITTGTMRGAALRSLHFQRVKYLGSGPCARQ